MDRALIIDEPWISKILSGEKTWEMRSRATTVRGRIGLIRKGSGLIVGEVDIVEVLDFNQQRDVLERYTEEHCIDYSGKDREFLQKYDVAWVLENAKKYIEPIPYKHPQGAVIWVKFGGIMQTIEDGRENQCACRRSDAWKCAVDQNLRTVSCPCGCHRKRGAR